MLVQRKILSTSYLGHRALSSSKKGCYFSHGLIWVVLHCSTYRASKTQNGKSWHLCTERLHFPAIYLPATQCELFHSNESSEHTVLVSMSASLVGAFYSDLPPSLKKERSEQTWILCPCQYTRANKIVLWKLWLDISRPCLDRSMTTLWIGIHTERQNKIAPGPNIEKSDVWIFYIYLSTSQRSRNLFMAFFRLNHWKEALSWHFTLLPDSSSKWRMEQVWSSILSIRWTQVGGNSFMFKLYATHRTSSFFWKFWKNSKQILFLKNWDLKEVLFSKRKYWGVGM